MPFLQIERTIVPIRLDGATEKAPEEGGDDERAFAGNLRTTVRWTRRNWSMGSKGLLIIDAEFLRALCCRGKFLMVTGDAIGNAATDVNGMAAAPVGVGVATAAGGALAAATYYYKVTGMNSRGETVGSAEVNVVTALNNKNTISWTALTGATWYRVYYVAGGPTGAENFFFDNIVGTSFVHDGLTLPIHGPESPLIQYGPPTSALVGFYSRIALADGPFVKVKGTHRRQMILNIRQV